MPFSQFHDRELVDYGEEALARSFFDLWRASRGKSPALAECVGYRQPLLPGGRDSIDNHEFSDLDAYWTIMGQLRR